MTEKTGRELARLRGLKKLTQRDVAAAVGVRHGAVANWEMGYSLPSQEYWAKYARVLGTGIDVFLQERMNRRPRRRRAS